MNVPLSWLADYVKLPRDIQTLTDKLTDVGHMLDKTTQVNGETVIDLELRGNRADMFGLIGVAREVAAITGSKLKLPPVAPLPPGDKDSPLINVLPSAFGLVRRYLAVKLKVVVGPSPQWLVDRLTTYGIPAVNNVVDVTNYVMVETSHPLHAFDYPKIAGGRLILRRAKPGEKFATVQQGTTLTLSSEELAICDQTAVHCLTMIGGADSKVTDQTTHIILESAVYHPAACRRSARRLKTITEGGTRHEKHQDPAGVGWAVQRAVYLLIQTAAAKVVGLTSDYYPRPVKPRVINFKETEVTRLTGLTVPRKTITRILAGLEFKVSGDTVTVPSFRTDVEGSADVVEEVIRMHGYNHIPSTAIADPAPVPSSYPSFIVGERLKEVCTNLGLDEVITLSLVRTGEIRLANPPDPAIGYLRSRLTPSLIAYAHRRLNLRQDKVAIFEIGKTFSIRAGRYHEHFRWGIVVAGKSVTTSHLTGIVQTAARLLGIDSLPTIEVGETAGVYWVEVNVDRLQKSLPAFTNPYSVISAFPPIIEDVNITYQGNYAGLVRKIKKLSPLITGIELVDKFGFKLTLRLTYHSDKKQLSWTAIAPIRSKVAVITQAE